MEDFEWSVINEGHLLDAMVGHKPVGVNKYFQMAFICDKFTDNLHKDIDPEKVWAHLETMYNLEALDESETIPFPNIEREFDLPESEFGNLISKKEKEEEKMKIGTPKGGRETPKLTKTVKEEKTPAKKEHRDGKDVRDNNKTPASAKKEMPKRESDKPRNQKGNKKNKDETPKIKRSTRGSLKNNDDSGSSGKSSPVTITPPITKRRRI